MMIKMYAIFSREGVAKMQGNKGKMCAQAGHAYLHAWWNAEEMLAKFQDFEDDENRDLTDAVRLSSAMHQYKYANDARKIALLVNTDDELRQLADDYSSFTGVTIVEDCGYTIVEPGTMTCIGIGPLRDTEKGDDLRDLRLFM